MGLLYFLSCFTIGLLTEVGEYEYGSTSSSSVVDCDLHSVSDIGSNNEKIYEIEFNITDMEHASDSSSSIPFSSGRSSFASQASDNGIFQLGSNRSRSSSEASQPTVAHWCCLIFGFVKLAGAYVIRAFASLISKIKKACSRCRVLAGEERFANFEI